MGIVFTLPSELVNSLDKQSYLTVHEKGGRPNSETTVYGWWKWWCWCPTSDEILKKAEEKMLEGIETNKKSYFVKLPDGNKIRTIETINHLESPERLPLVMLHGFGAGVALWVMNIDDLAKNQKVYGIDVLGFGRSSRPQFPENKAAEELFMYSLEEWRKDRNIEKFILLGHSFGAYLASSYTLKYPARVRHLILADPWGLPEKNPETEKSFQLPLWARGIASIVSLFNPLDALRLIGPLGPPLLRRVRSDLQKKFEHAFPGKNDSRVIDYLYHVLIQNPSGEAAFMSMTIPYGWAKYPMLKQLSENLKDTPITIFYGSRSWMYIKAGLELKQKRSSYVHFHIIPDASHHCYGDDPEKFNSLVNKTCEKVFLSTDTAEELEKSGDQLTYDLKDFDNFASFLRPV